jgi:PAS domain S-box-containing protein
VINNNEMDRVLIICREVSKENNILSNAHELNHTFTSIIDRIEDVIVSVNEAGDIKVYNKAFLKLINYDKYSINSKKVFEVMHIDNQLMNNQENLKEMQTDNYKVLNNCVIEIIATGKKKQCSLTISKYRLSDCSSQILIIIKDVDAQRKVLNEIVKLKNLEVLQNSMLHIANDFNNVLTAIMGHIALLKMNPNIPAQMYDRILKTEEASIKAMELTHKIFPLDNVGNVSRDFYNINDIIDSIIDNTPSNYRIDKKVNPELAPVYINYQITKKAILQIFNNACESMPDGGLINFGCEEVNIYQNNIYNLNEGKYLKLQMTDKGSGILPENQERIFEPYFSTKNREGLGLTNAFYLLRSEDAYINIVSEPGKGTTAEIYLPEKSSSYHDNSRVQDINRKIRVLFMDDEQLVLDIAEEYLHRLGFEVSLVINGEQVISALEKDETYDVVILDLVVSEGLGARDTIKIIRERNYRQKVFLSTGLKTEVTLMDYKKYGFDDAIEKPIDFLLLKEKIYKHLYESR